MASDLQWRLIPAGRYSVGDLEHESGGSLTCRRCRADLSGPDPVPCIREVVTLESPLLIAGPVLTGLYEEWFVKDAYRGDRKEFDAENEFFGSRWINPLDAPLDIGDTSEYGRPAFCSWLWEQMAVPCDLPGGVHFVDPDDDHRIGPRPAVGGGCVVAPCGQCGGVGRVVRIPCPACGGGCEVGWTVHTDIGDEVETAPCDDCMPCDCDAACDHEPTGYIIARSFRPATEIETAAAEGRVGEFWIVAEVVP